MSHPSIPTLERYHNGCSPPEEKATVRAHLSVCDSCSSYLRETDLILELLGE
jgi:hypothetical protein